MGNCIDVQAAEIAELKTELARRKGGRPKKGEAKKTAARKPKPSAAATT